MTVRRTRRLAYAVMVALNLGVFAAGILGVAWWRRLQAIPIPTQMEGTITAGFFEQAEDVGYIPRANQQVTARRVAATGIVYDVTYTIGADHFRIMPPPGALKPASCAALFGDSFTFGEGVDDDKTYPWQLVAGSNRRIQAYNFGIGGWGPHQMLAGLQSGRFERAMNCQPTVAVYTMIGGHMRRVAGREAWSQGPRFRLGAEGSAVRDGSIDNAGSREADPLDEGFLAWRRLLGVRRSGTHEDVALTASIFAQSRRELESLPLRPSLHLIYWDTYVDTRIEALFQRLSSDGVVVHRIESIIPDFRHDRLKYEISVADGHPNPLAHGIVADYVAGRIIGSGGR